MSNKVVPQVYRAIIDDVIASVQVDFDEYGMEEDVLINLQAKWEAKLLETRVAEFNRAPGTKASPEADSPNLHARGNGEASNVAGPFRQSANMANYGPTGAQPQYAFPPPLHGLALPGQGSTSAGAGIMNGGGFRREQAVRVKAEPEDVLRLRGGAPAPEQDLKPNLDLKPKQEPNAAGLLPGDEVIDSDLDDSDDELRDEGEEDAEGDIDIVFCVYDKVQRVKNKWKTIFKDGMIHINGKDYLFAKCNGEFEW